MQRSMQDSRGNRRAEALTQASFIIEMGVREVEITMVFPVIELDRNRVVGFLVNAPDATD